MPIKIKVVDAASSTSEKAYLERFQSYGLDVELSENPDFLFYEPYGREYLKYDCIRIFETGENVIPDFNECDYATGYDYIEYGDRYLRRPLYYSYERDYSLALKKHIDIPNNACERKFCNFVYSNGNADYRREQFYHLLSKYRIIDSGGRFLNNIGGPVEDKYEFQRKYKFSIAFENASMPGYATEKIIQAFAAGTIPIYWGDPTIGNQFNEKAFVNCHSYNSYEEVIEKVREIDSDNELYKSYLSQPIWKEKELFPDNPRDVYRDFEMSILSRDPKQARRRCTVMYAGPKGEKVLQDYAKLLDDRKKYWFVNIPFKFLDRYRNLFERESK